jgi:Family of unknown function (DUF5681)
MNSYDDDGHDGAGPDPSKPTSQKQYDVGYGRPPVKTQWKPGESGNPNGRPAGQPSVDEIILEEAARLLKIQAGDGEIKISSKRAVFRKLFQLVVAKGNVGAARLLLARLDIAEAAKAKAHPPEEPLTADELETLKLMMKSEGGGDAPGDQ